MKVKELLAILEAVENKDAPVLFDTEAARFHWHMVPIDAAYYEEQPEPHVQLHTHDAREH
jgi:hypothetical protein